MPSVGGHPKVGLILTTYDDMPEAREAYHSLWNTQYQYPFEMVVVDAGSTDGTLQFFWDRGHKVYADVKHLSKALNIGIQYFIDESKDYIGWVHPDMMFPQKDWLAALVHLLEGDESIGKLAPDVYGSTGEDMRAGNSCPWLIPSSILVGLMLEYGFYFDEKFLYCGGYEDWDLNRRIMHHEKKVLITTQSQLKHEGMKSRAKPRAGVKDYHNAGRINAGTYQAKWGDTSPPC